MAKTGAQAGIGGGLVALVALALAGASSARADSWNEKRPSFAPAVRPTAPAPGKTQAPSKAQVPGKTQARPRAASPGPAPTPRKSGSSPLEENDILLGFKAGGQFTSFTDVLIDGQSRTLPNGTGYAAGAALFWNVGLPRLEFDVLVNTRQQGSRQPVSYVGIPALVKFCPAENSWLTWSAGAGIQVDSAIGGAGTRRGVLIGLPVATDLLLDTGAGFFLAFEARFNFGMLTFDGGTTGGRSRDLNLLGGLLFPIDRTGF